MRPFVFFSLSAALLSAFELLITKYVFKNTIKNVFLFLFYFFLLRLVAALPFVFFLPSLPKTLSALPFSFVSAVTWMIGTILVFYALSKKDASVVGSLYPLKLMIVPLIAYVLLGEVFSQSTYFWIIPLIIGGFLVTMDETFTITSFFQKAVALVLVGLTSYSISDSFSKMAVDQIGSFASLCLFLACIGILSFSLLPFIKGKIHISKHQLKFVVLLVFFDALINTFFALSLRDNVTLTNAITMLNAPFLLVFSFLVTKFKPGLIEKHGSKVYAVRAIGAGIMYIAALALVLQ